MRTKSMLKRTVKTIVTMLLLTAMTAAMPGAGAAYAENGQSFTVKDPENVDARDWMKYLPDDVLLSDLNLPGAHDAGTNRVLCDDEDKVWYQCQIDPIGDQKWINQHWFSKDEEIVDTGMLQKGVRYLDLRFFIPNGEASTADNLVLAHGGKVCAYRVYQDHFYVNRCEHTTNEHLLWWVKTFLDAHKGETVILDFDTDIDAGDKKPLYNFYKQLAEDQVNGKKNSYPDIYIGDHVPTLGEARGKVVIFSHLNAGDIGGKWGEYPVYDKNKKYCGEWAMQISNTRGDSKIETSAEAYACIKKNMKYIVQMENVFDDVDQEKKWEYIKNSLNDAQKNRDAYRKKGYATWMMTFTTANDIEHFKVWRTPGWYVKYVQSRTRNLINDKLNSFYGIVIMDGIDGSYAPDISKTVWKSNYHRYLDVSYEWSSDNSKCTAIGKRVLDGKTIKVTVDTQKEEKAATCTEDGSATYTADFSRSDAASWAAEQKKSVKTGKLHHDLIMAQNQDDTDTLTVSCSREGCPLHAASVIRLVTPDKTYDGNSYDLAKLSGLDEFRRKASKDDTITITEGSLSYEKKEGSVYTALDNAPSDAGEYKASVIIKIKSNNKEETDHTLSGSFSIAKKALKVTGISASDKVYDGNTDAELDYKDAELEGVAEKDKGKIGFDKTGVSGSFEDADAAFDKKVYVSGLSLSGDESVISNYSLQTTAETTANISKRPVKVIANHQVILENGNIKNDTAHARLGEGTGSGRPYSPVDGHVLSEVSLTEDRTEHTITPSQAVIKDSNNDNVTGNYSITYETGELTIYKETGQFTEPAARDGIVYNGNDQTLLTGGENVVYSSNGSTQVQLSDLTGKDAGSYTVYWKPASSSVTWQPITVTIAPKPVTITPNDALTKTYGDEDPELKYTVSGLEKGDVLKGALSRVRGEDVGEYAITRGMLNNPNYKITVSDGKKLTINTREVTISGIKGKDKVYDGNNDVELDFSDVVIDGLAPWDEGKVTVAAEGEFVTPDAGNDKLIDLSEVSLTGTGSGNYSFTDSQSTAYAAISKRPVKVTAKPQGIVESKGEDISHELEKAELESSGTGRGAVSGHVLTAVNLTNGMQETPSVREIIPSDAKISDAESKDATGNYDIEYVNGKLTVMTVPLISEPGPIVHTYDGDNKIMVQPGKTRDGYVLQYAIADEMPSPDSSAWSTEYPEAKDAGLYTVWWRPVAVQDAGGAAGTESVSTMDTNDASDDEPLTLVHGGSIKAMIIPNSVDLSWSPTSFIYDGREHLPGPKAVNLAEGDECTVTAKGAQTKPGRYKATAVSVSNPNYEITEYSKGVETEYTIVKEKAVSKGTRTGDGSYLILWILTLMLSAAMSGILVLKRRKGRAGGR